MPNIAKNLLITGAASTLGAALMSTPGMSVATTIGTLFSPAAVATAGGVAKIIGATVAGSLITTIPATWGLLIASGLLVMGLNLDNSTLINMGVIAGLVDIAATYILAAQIGASLTGTAASTVMFCNALGATIMILGATMAIAGLMVSMGAIASTITAHHHAPRRP